MRASREISRGLAGRGHELHLFRYRYDRAILDLHGIPEDSGDPLDDAPFAAVHELPDPRPSHRGMRAMGWRVRTTLENVQKLYDLKAFDRAAKTAARAIDDLGCDVVLLHLCVFTNAPLLARHLKTRTLWYCQEPTRDLFETADCILDRNRGFPERQYRDQRRRAEVAAAHAARTVLCNSSFSKEFILRALDCEAQVCRLGVDADTFTPMNGSVKLNQVICWGPLWPSKALDFIIRGVARIPCGARPKVVLPWTRGSDGYYRMLEALSRQLGVIMEAPQGLSDSELLERIHESKLCVYVPHLEPLGLVALEAMAAGLPVVGVREGGVRETVLDGVTGFLCERDEKEVSRRVRQILSDEPLRRRLASQAVDYVRDRWTWTDAVDRIEALVTGRDGDAATRRQAEKAA